MTTTLEIHRERRDAMLARITDNLAADQRFMAGWLTGSLAGKEADALSDIDITLVVADPYSEALCRRLEQISSHTSPERYSLFKQSGTPALIHENNNNAPEGGTFTFVLYSGSAVMVDWTLLPQSRARRPAQSIPLFEKIPIPIAPSPEPEPLDQSKEAVAEIWAFFWMMAIVTIKYTLRGDRVFAARWVESLHGMAREIVRRLDRKPWQYTRGSLSSLQTTPEEQLKSIRELCNRTLQLQDRVSEFLGSEPLTPQAEIEELFLLAQQSIHHSNIINLKS
jgi:hypothetical protein